MSGKKRGAPENDQSHGDAFRSELSIFVDVIKVVGSLLNQSERDSLVTPLITLIIEIGELPLLNNAETTAAYNLVNGEMLRALIGVLNRRGFEIEAQDMADARTKLRNKVARVPNDPSTRARIPYGESNNNHFSSVGGRRRRR